MSYKRRKGRAIVEAQKSCYFRKKILEWHRGNERHFPWRKTKNAYHILVAEILLQQTDAAKVSKEYSSFIRRFPHPTKLARASRPSVTRFISKLGLDYRVDRLISVARKLEREFKGVVPSTEERLLQLPGVGPYIANAVLASAYNKRAGVLDTNIVRILDRFFGLRSSRPRARTDPTLWEAAQKLLPRKTSMCQTWNYALLDFAALVCTHYNPRCGKCPCRRRCNYFTALDELAESAKQNHSVKHRHP